MRFSVYHHNDLDGLAGSAIFAKFLCLKDNMGFDDFDFYSVDYTLKQQWLSCELKNPCAVIDFLYHPDSDWWFDHHDSTFQGNTQFRNAYTHSPTKYWDVKFLSCPSLILSHIEKYFSEYFAGLKQTYAELVKWSDVIDGARYHSPKEVYEYDNIYININKTLAINYNDAYARNVIKAFFDNDLHSLTSSPEYNTALERYRGQEQEAIRIIKSIIQVDEGIASVDQSLYDIPFQRYLPYYLFPQIFYSVAIVKKEEKFSVSVNYNNWLPKQNKIDLGSICNELGGGGRFNVGGVISNDHHTAVSIAEKIKGRIRNLMHAERIEAYPQTDTAKKQAP